MRAVGWNKPAEESFIRCQKPVQNSPVRGALTALAAHSESAAAENDFWTIEVHASAVLGHRIATCTMIHVDAAVVCRGRGRVRPAPTHHVDATAV